jgi:CHAD domain-containing protein
MDLSTHRTAVGTGTTSALERLAREALGACHTDLQAARQVVLSSRAPTGIHGTRVALRRLRAAATLFGRPLADERILDLRADAKQLADACGATRDLDVFLAGVLAEIEKFFADNADLAAELRNLRATALRLRRSRHDAVRTVLSGEAFLAFEARLAALMATPEPRTALPSLLTSPAPDRAEPADVVAVPDAVEFARDVLRRRDRKLRKLLKKFDELDGPARHQVRLRVKKQRYAASFLAGLFDRKPGAAYIHAAAGLQDALGLANDRVVAAHVVSDIRAAARPKGRLDWIAGVVTGWLEMQARAVDEDRAVAVAARRFRRAPRFWRGAAREDGVTG